MLWRSTFTSYTAHEVMKLKERRRAFSLRLLGDDAKYKQRSGPTSPPPFPGQEVKEVQKLREDGFSVILNR